MGSTSTESDFYKILIVDDDEDVLQITRLVMQDYQFRERPIQIYSAQTAQEAKALLDAHQDIAIVMVDIVMEETDSGLKLVDWLRKEKGDSRTRIVLRSGHPDIASEKQLVGQYDIDVYLEKSATKEEHLLSTLTTALRSYEHICTLESYNILLEEKIRERTQALEELNKNLELRVQQEIEKRGKLEMDNQEKQELIVQNSKMVALGQMVAGFSHEIMTPMGVSVTAVSSLQELIRQIKRRFQNNHVTKSSFDKFLEESEEAVEIILTNIQRSSEMIESMKHIAVDQSSGQKRKFNIYEYLQEILLSLKPKLKRTEHAVIIDCEPNLKVESYPGYISQIFTNLIINSLIHGFDGWKTGGEIRIAAKVEENSLLRFEYTDNGNGMPEEVRQRVFEQYYTTRKNDGGSGVGMHLIHQIITEKLNGTLTLESQPKQGVCFQFTIPLT